MPLPGNGLAWPPAQLATVAPAMEVWSAWFSGSPAALEHAYQHERHHHTTGVPANRPSQFRGGVVGAVGRMFWGAPRHNLTVPAKPKLHVPLAGDICQASADLLFSEPPSITVDDQVTNDRLRDLVGDGMLSTLAEAAELAAALGGTYLRVTWDAASQPDGPFLSAVDADGAWPEFRWGRLTAVTFWTVVTDVNDVVTRHLERHETAPGGNGIVLHGLYEGTRDNLGRTIPLTSDVVGQGLLDSLTEGQTIDTLSPGLAVVYVPNQRPQRRWRHDPLGRNLGRADLDGVEGLMDALDETYTSWMRDIRLGKGRVFVARSMLDGGQVAAMPDGTRRKLPATFDVDQEIFAPLDMLANPNAQGSGLPIQAEQFAIRYAEHQATASELVTQILRTAGYSTQTFGDGDGNTAGDRTATEVQARQQRSYMTRDRKVRLWRPALAEVIEKLLAVDRDIFTHPVTPSRPDVVFGDGVQESQLALAQTAQALYTASAASRETLVGMVHPDWDDEQITAEVSKIQAEHAAAVPVADPFGAPQLPPDQ